MTLLVPVQPKQRSAILFVAYDLERFLLTRHVKIEPDVIPHSHPVLARVTEFAHEPERYLACFLHEQMHWM